MPTPLLPQALVLEFVGELDIRRHWHTKIIVAKSIWRFNYESFVLTIVKAAVLEANYPLQAVIRCH